MGAGNYLFEHIYNLAQHCRGGMGEMDYGALFRIMDLERVGAGDQLDILEKVQVVEGMRMKAQMDKVEDGE